MLVLTTLLGESTGAIVDPLVTVDLLAASAGDSAAATVVLNGTGRRGTVETTTGKDERTAAGTRRGVDNAVDPRLSFGVVPCQPSELSWRFAPSASWTWGWAVPGKCIESDESGLLACCLPGCCRSGRRWG